MPANALKKLFISNIIWLISYQILRVLFAHYYFNADAFSAIDWLKIAYWGFRLDFTALFVFNFLFILIFVLNLGLIKSRLIDRLNTHGYLLINLFFIVLNIVDLFYFEYNNRRISYSNFYLISSSIPAFTGTLGMYISACVAASIFLILLYYIQTKIWMFPRQIWVKIQFKPFLVVFPLLIVLTYNLVTEKLFFRPITPFTPLLYCEAEFQPLVNNTTLNFLYSMYKRNGQVSNENYFSNKTLDTIFTVTRRHEQKANFSRKNVVLFLMESVSYEHINERVMPFLSGIKSKSLDFTNIYQNGHESVHGTVATFASIPPFLEAPFYLSDFASIEYIPMGTIFKKQGYSTHFFLGADYDHFNFTKLTKMLHVDTYYSSKGLKNKSNYDGTWGIFDGFFLDYFSKITASIKEPFFSVFYNITTHPPFRIPNTYAKKYQPLELNHQEKSLRYFDEMLKDFFSKHKNEQWFQNSVFIFTSDHTLGVNNKTSLQEFKKNLHIPFFIFEQQKEMDQTKDNYGQQLDIIPTILDYLNYKESYYAFGSSLLQSNRRNYFITLLNGVYRYETKQCIIGFDIKSDKVVYCFTKKGGKWIKTSDYQKLYDDMQFIKAFIQRYFDVLTKNSMLGQAHRNLR